MPRIPKGVTLTPEERAQAGYTSSSASSADTIHSHTCSVSLPDGKPCKVDYRRYTARSHEFKFAAPVCERIYVTTTIEASLPSIEAKAQELSEQAFRMAQKAEREQMQKKMPLGKKAKRPDTGPQMSVQNAEQMAGKYAPCVRHKSGRLLRIGRVYDTPEQAAQEIASGKFSRLRLVNGQELVVGICNRQAQCWQEPQFAAKPVIEDDDDQDLDGDDELENQLADEDDIE